MRISKWGNSLAVRIPVAVARAMNLKEGDEVEIARPANSSRANTMTVDERREILEQLHSFRGLLPADFKFDREEANAR
jgi:antitoxin MazE